MKFVFHIVYLCFLLLLSFMVFVLLGIRGVLLVAVSQGFLLFLSFMVFLLFGILGVLVVSSGVLLFLFLLWLLFLLVFMVFLWFLIV